MLAVSVFIPRPHNTKDLVGSDIDFVKASYCGELGWNASVDGGFPILLKGYITEEVFQSFLQDCNESLKVTKLCCRGPLFHIPNFLLRC